MTDLALPLLDLLSLKAMLRGGSRSMREALVLDPAELALGYHECLAKAPPRTRPYLSDTRRGDHVQRRFQQSC